MAQEQSIQIEYMTSSFVRIECKAGLAAQKFLRDNARHMDCVSFGDRGAAHPGNHAIKIDRLPRFLAHAEKNGVAVYWVRNGGFVKSTFAAEQAMLEAA